MCGGEVVDVGKLGTLKGDRGICINKRIGFGWEVFLRHNAYGRGEGVMVVQLKWCCAFAMDPTGM